MASTVLALALGGCEEGGARRDAKASTPHLPRGRDTAWLRRARVAVIDYRAFRGKVYVPLQATYGQPIPVRMAVRNTSDRPVWLETGDSAYAFDIVVTDSAGAEVWSRLRSRRADAIPAIIRSHPIAPGDSVLYTDWWDQRTNAGKQVAPGLYRIRGVLDTHEDAESVADMRTARETVRVVP